MSALDNSFASEQESPTRAKSHSLCQELQQLGAKLTNQDLNISKPDTESEDCNDSSFISPNNKNRLEHEPSFQQCSKSKQILSEPNIGQILQSSQQNQFQQDKQNPIQANTLSQLKQKDIAKQTQEQENKKQNQKQQDNSSQSPKTITLVEDDFLSREQTINMSSKLSQYSMEVDNESYASFLSIKDTSYCALIKNFQLLFQSVSNLFSQRVNSISSTYLTFLKLKLAQQKSFASLKLSHVQSKKNNIIQIDCKAIAEQIRLKVQQSTQSRNSFYVTLQQCYLKLQKHVQSIKISMQSKQTKIKQIFAKINQTGNQMSDLMIPQNRKKQKKNINPQIYKSSFIRTKYLMNKQKIYLSLIANYLRLVLSYIGYVCIQVEPKNCLAVKQALIAYGQAVLSIKSKHHENVKNKIEILSKTNCYKQTYQQVYRLLQLCIPEAIRPINSMHCSDSYNTQQTSQKKLKRTIQSLISESQSLVYIPVIELENKDYAYHSKNKANIKWLRVNHNQKYKSECIQQIDIYVVVTHEGDLILQVINKQSQKNRNQDQKMAILKLKNIKMSRKENRVYMVDRGNGMLGYLFSTDSVLGTLCFQSLEGSQNMQTEQSIIDQFIQRVKDVLQQKKDNKKEKK